MIFPVTSFYSGLATLYTVYLTAKTIQQRAKLGISLGDGTFEAVQRAVLSEDKIKREHFSLAAAHYQPLKVAKSAHANFLEYTPLFLINLLVLEGNDNSSALIHSIGASYFIGRILHTYGMNAPKALGLGRKIGMALSLLAIITVAGINIYDFVKNLM